MEKKNVIIGTAVFVVALFLIILIGREGTKKTSTTTNVFRTVKEGTFEVVVLTTGELQAENYSTIMAPSALQSRNLRASSIKITDLVSEGTVVKKGDYVGELDRTDMDNTLKTELETLNTLETNLEMKMLDTAVTLSNARDDIKNTVFSLDEAKIVLDQSKFEPPATIRKAEMNLDRIKRSLEQSKSSYELKVQQNTSDINSIKNNLVKQQQKVNELQNVLNLFTITAPGDGMVIYKKEVDGTKRKVGSSITSFDLTVATLPDLSSMISKTYVNEIDVSKIRKGQEVRIMVDAFSERRYKGEVINVSNIGEQLPSTDAKVFEVLVRLTEIDAVIRPSMTTGNIIVVETLKNVISVPLGSIVVDDGKTYVYTEDKDKIEVKLGVSNESEIVVESGLESGTVIYTDNPMLLAKN
jgi:multidrug efflux pump subunit AcrA (membrane-fusion protein)